MNRRRQRGFTLIELMVALVVSSVLAGMILAIFSRMSSAYRGQQQIAGVQQVLAAARAAIELDAKQAGLAMAQGFKLAGDPTVAQSPIQVTNSSTGPDQIKFFYADPTNQAVVQAPAPAAWAALPSVTVDATGGFVEGDLVVLSKPDLTVVSPVVGGANIVIHDACVLQIAPGGVVAGPPSTLTFSTVAPWGRADSSQCTTPVPGATLIYKLVAHAYRIDPDPARTELGPLQWSLTGGLIGTAADNWTDLAYGFTDLQTALRSYDNTSLVDADGDGVVTQNWVSGGSADLGTGVTPVAPPPSIQKTLIQASISLVARTDRDVEGIATAATPQLIDPARPNNNPIGDHPSVALPWAIDPSIPGRIYRYTTFQVDLRNLGVGR